MINLNSFIKNGIDGIMKTAARFNLNNSKGRKFVTRIVSRFSKSTGLREQNEQNGVHVPAFLIASITSQCNLRCVGCYARAGSGCGESGAETDLTAKEWDSIFGEAAALGVSFILLAGGEPLLRRDVIETAASHKNLIFPIFTNGTVIDAAYLELFDNSRNILPVLSIEGEAEKTDERRGGGIHATVENAMARLCEKHILFGVSITVTKENAKHVTSGGFVSELREKGCGIVFFVEYVPAEKGTEYLVLGKEEMQQLNATTDKLKTRFDDMIIMSFPGDEAAMGGCLASGRGFFHINSKGGAEPCPFSPHSKHNLKDTAMAEILCSDYFKKLRDIAAKAGEHAGGCVLFERENEVTALLEEHVEA